MMGVKDSQLKGYVEPKVTSAVQEYADRNGLTKSQAVRRLVIMGLKVERVRDEAAAEAEANLLSIPA